MREGHVIIGDIVEEVDFLLLEEKTSGDGVHRSIAPAFVKEATVSIEGIEIIEVGRRPQPVEVSDLEIGPLMGFLY